MDNHQIKFYPVGNGDTSLISLNDDTTILIDCNIRTKSTDENDKSYDVKSDLIESIQKSTDNPFIDVFVLTHPDNDHCRGFEKHFYQGDPDDYEKENRDNEEIIIDELWVTSKLFTYEQSDDANIVRKEANRRKKLYVNNDNSKENKGNRLRIIGFDGEDKLEDVPHYHAGHLVEKFNRKTFEDFSVFIHAPFNEELQNNTSGKNETSITFQARFKKNSNDKDFSTLALFGGDSDHYVWEKILKETKNHDNEDKLKWDIFLAPHHCSWTFFNDTPQKENKTPKDCSLEILDYKNDNAKVIASSKKIKNDDDNPPHYEAKRQYVKKVNEENFHNTEIYNIKDGVPQPIIFEVTKQGPMFPKQKESNARQTGSFAAGAINSPTEYGE